MPTLPDDWSCPVLDAGFIKDIETECYAKLERFTTNAEGIILCARCLKEVGVETDLEAGMAVEDGAGDDDDDDGNLDNPEFNNAEVLLEGELVNWSPEETMRNEVTGVLFTIVEELQTYPNVNLDDITDVDEREHYESLGNTTTHYAAYLTTHSDNIVNLYMHFSVHGINAFGGRVSNRRDALLAVILVYRMNEGHVLDEYDMVARLGEKPNYIANLRDILIRAQLAEGQNETGYYITLYARAFGLDDAIVQAISDEWDRDIEPFMAQTPQIIALAFLLSALENQHDMKKSTSGPASQLGLNRTTVGSARKKFDNHFRTIKATS